MKYLNVFLCILMLLFIGVQYNDPDGLLWSVIYSVPAIWTALAAFRLKQMTKPLPITLLTVSVVGALILTVFYWPTTPDFWRTEIYWETETAREGMGMMIASFVTLVAAGTIWSAKIKASRDA